MNMNYIIRQTRIASQVDRQDPSDPGPSEARRYDRKAGQGFFPTRVSQSRSQSLGRGQGGLLLLPVSPEVCNAK
jgi:hypothetical protein